MLVENLWGEGGFGGDAQVHVRVPNRVPKDSGDAGKGLNKTLNSINPYAPPPSNSQGA